MNALTARPYDTLNDLALMKTVLQAGASARPHSTYVHIGDLDWWAYFILSDYDFRDLAHLWEHDGRVVGWTLVTPGDAAYDLYLLPEYRAEEHLNAILDWLEPRMAQEARREDLTYYENGWVFEDDTLWRDVLLARGYTRADDYTLLKFSHDLRDIAAPALPPGFVVRGMSDADTDSRAECHRQAFAPSRMTPERFRHFRGAPGYDPELDVVVIAPDGRVAAYTQGWLDTVNRVGLFEPVGTHPDFQRRGLGLAANLACLHRMKARGMTRAIVGADADNPASQALYRRAGFALVNRVYAYQKAVSVAQPGVRPIWNAILL